MTPAVGPSRRQVLGAAQENRSFDLVGPVDPREDGVDDDPVLGGWDVVVQGPNRFWCELAGSVAGVAAAVDVRPTYRRRTGGLVLTLVNGGSSTVTLEVGRRTVAVPAGGQHRVETGRDSVTA